MKRPLLIVCLLFLGAGPTRAAAPPDWLPHYTLDLRIDPATRLIDGAMSVTWTNTAAQATTEIVLNAHARYTVPDADIGLIAKTLEVLRLAPSEALSFDGPALEIASAKLLSFQPKASKPRRADKDAAPLPFHYATDNPTALVVRLPEAVQPGDKVSFALTFSIKLPAKKGRWGQWDGVTVLAQGLPTVAVYDDKGWHPSPFLPWHQPFYNEAGIYSARLTLPADQKLACSGPVVRTISEADGWVTHECSTTCVRDFSFMCSNRYEEHTGTADGVAIRVLALPEHAHFGAELVRYISEALPVYNRWFGRYPYPQFTVADAYFGWNGNECGSLVMIDTRMMGQSKIAASYVDHLITHELCHQWWYNVVGTNGYAETWMDEGLATYFSHRLTDEKYGPDKNILKYPTALEWLPNIRREDFRNYGYIGAYKYGIHMPTVQEMPKYEHLMNLSSATYDRGSKVVGLIEQRLGPDNMLDFMKQVFAKYQWRILRVADFQRELEAYTKEDWSPFFRQWVYGPDQCDWTVDRVEVNGDCRPFVSLLHRSKRGQEPTRVVVHLKQKGCFNEQTVLGIRLPCKKCNDAPDAYQIRIPIIPNIPVLPLPECNAVVFCSQKIIDDRHQTADVRVEITLPAAPEQISVDPDRILLDECPTNNHWKHECRIRFTPLYTMLEEADVTNPYDRPSVIFGPYVYGSAFNDPWFAKSPLLGFRAGCYQTQEVCGGVYGAFRTYDQNFVVGADGMLDHFPFPKTQVGFMVEQSLGTLDSGDPTNNRGVLYFRHVLMRGSSLYLPPFEYWETFAAYQNRPIPDPRMPTPGADPFHERPSLGAHYHKYLLTPYWDPEGGVALDLSVQAGFPIFGNDAYFQQAYGQLSFVKSAPKLEWLGDNPILNHLRDTRWAFRIAGAAALPLRGQFFSLGGPDMFRGFDLRERQGSVAWVGSVEWRVPVLRHTCLDFCDHVGGVRGLYLAPFYDVGDAMVSGHSQGPVAHAFGIGLRLDVAWLGLIERTMLRFDLAKTINVDTPWQFSFGVMHPF